MYSKSSGRGFRFSHLLSCVVRNEDILVREKFFSSLKCAVPESAKIGNVMEIGVISDCGNDAVLKVALDEGENDRYSEGAFWGYWDLESRTRIHNGLRIPKQQK